MYIDSFKKEATNKDYSLCGFGNVLIASQAKGSAKSVTFPLGFDESAPDTNLAFKVVFSQGHDASNSTDYMTLNGIQVDANVNGTLQPLPIHAMDESGTTVYKVLDPNTVLEMYYTSNDGSGNPAFVVIGNPLVLSSATYSIYANGHYELLKITTDEQWTGHYWNDGKKIYTRMISDTKSFPYHSFIVLFSYSDYNIDTLISVQETPFSNNSDSYFFKCTAYGFDISFDRKVRAWNTYTNGSTITKSYILIIEYTKTSS